MKETGEVSLKEMQEIAMQGLLFFRSICEKHNLTYFLAYGTLLGAVRHGGFIPWDDDIDLLMPREDYERFLSVCKEEETDEWDILSYRYDEGYWLPWIKICNNSTMILPSRFHSGRVYGVSIDIFPLDSFGSTSDLKESEREILELRSFYKKKMKQLKPHAVIKSGAKNAIKRFIKKSYFLLNNKSDEIPAALKEYESKIPRSEGRYVAYVLARNGLPIWEKELFLKNDEDYNYLSFEGEKFRVPLDTHKVLAGSYGESYMTLPPEKDRVTNHSYICKFKH